VQREDLSTPMPLEILRTVKVSLRRRSDDDDNTLVGWIPVCHPQQFNLTFTVSPTLKG
jgi:hypothetical protein